LKEDKNSPLMSEEIKTVHLFKELDFDGFF